MKHQVLYRRPWTKENVKILVRWWPHFGTRWVAESLGLKWLQVKSKADKLGLKMLPKPKRLCVDCRSRHQKTRHAGNRCNACYLARRKSIRMGISVPASPKARKQHPKFYDSPRKRWISLAINTIRYRSTTPSNITIDYMLSLWEKQNGLCYYSNRPMREPAYGSGRHPDVASIDRIEPSKGYIQGNVVWCTWSCNAAKNNLSVSEFITLCSQVVCHWESQRRIFSGSGN